MTGEPRVRRLRTQDLSTAEAGAIRAMLVAAFGHDEEERFTDEDWDHAVGGMHFLVERDSRVVAHAAVIERDIHVTGRPLRTGYVEAVATAGDQQRRGLGSLVMRDVGDYLQRFELGALGTGSHAFYERQGWVTWRGPSSVRAPDGERPTPDEDGYIMVLRTRLTPELDLAAPISCEWRPGDVW